MPTRSEHTGGNTIEAVLARRGRARRGRRPLACAETALSAILFLYQQVLKQDIGRIDEVVRAKQPHRVPVVLTQDEVAAVLRHLIGATWSMGTLLTGLGIAAEILIQPYPLATSVPNKGVSRRVQPVTVGSRGWRPR